MSCTYLAHHELESDIFVVVIIYLFIYLFIVIIISAITITTVIDIITHLN